MKTFDGGRRQRSGGAQAPLTKLQLRAKEALASVRQRVTKSSAVSGAGPLAEREEALQALRRIRHARRLSELTGKTTSVARLRRHGAEEELLIEEIERKAEEEERREEMMKLGLAPPLPQSVLRPKPGKRKGSETIS